MKKVVGILLISATYLLFVSCGGEEAAVEAVGGITTGQVGTLDYFAYVVNYGSKNISINKIDSSTGGLTLVGVIGAGNGPWPSELDPQGRFFYAGNEDGNDINVYQINSTNGTLTEVSGSPFATGLEPEGMHVHPNGKFIYLATFSDDKVNVFEVSSSGTLTQVTGSPFATGDGPNDCAVHPTGKFLYVPSGNDGNVSAYAINESTGVLTEMPDSPYTAGSGSESAVINPSGDFLYILNGGADSISAYSIDQNTGALTPISGSPYTNVGTGPYDSAITPNGKFLYTITWGWDYDDNDVTVYSINSSTGALTLVAKYFVGFGLAGVTVHPNGDFLYVSDFHNGTDPGQVFIFSIDNENGSLTEISGSPFQAYAGTGYVRIQAIGDTATDTDVEDDEVSSVAGIGGVSMYDDPVLYHNLCVNDIVRAQALTNGGILYFGGDFTKVGKCSGAGVYLDVSNGGLTFPVEKSTFPLIGGTIYTSISDRNGGYYIGGSFSKVGSNTRYNIAHVNSDGYLTYFAPNVDGTVKSLALSGDGSIIYFGGDFSSVNGITRTDIAACYTSNGSLVTGFNPSSDWEVETLALKSDDSILYIGGYFSSINGTDRYNVAAVNTLDGSLVETFNPGTNSIVHNLVLNNNGSILYMGGGFDMVGGTSKKRIAAINTSDGSLVAGFTPADLNNSVYMMKLNSDNSIIYLGGAFTDIGGTTRNRIAALNTSDGTIISGFNPNSNARVRALELNGDGSIIYAGGDFTTIIGTSKNKIAAINTSDGSLVTTFGATFDNSVRSITLNSDASRLYVGGSFVMMDGVTRNKLAAINTGTGRLVSTFNPNVNESIRSLTLKSDDSILYLGGLFTTVDGTTRNRVAAVNTSDGSLVSGFDPNANNEVWTLLLTSDNSKLYLGGKFTTIAGTGRNFVAAVNTSNGSLVGSFNADVRDEASRDENVAALALTNDNSALYFGGYYRYIGATWVQNVRAVNTSNGSLITSFDPYADDQVWSIALNNDESIIYVGGILRSYQSGSSRYKLAAINTSNGDQVAAFNSFYLWGSLPVKSIKLTSDNSIIYSGGEFNRSRGRTDFGYGAVERNYMAAHNISDGSLVSSFDPDANAIVHSVVLNYDGSKLFVAGEFSTMGGSTRGRICQIKTTDGSVVNYLE